jgi:hypothetical protein
MPSRAAATLPTRAPLDFSRAFARHSIPLDPRTRGECELRKDALPIDLPTTIPEPRAVVDQLILRILANGQTVPQPAARVHLHNTWPVPKPTRWLAPEQPTDGLTGRDLQRAEFRNALIRAIADATWLYDNDPDRRLDE